MSKKEQPTRFDEIVRREIEQARLLEDARKKAIKITPDQPFRALSELEKMAAIYSSERVEVELNGKRTATPSEIAKVVNQGNKRR